MLKVDINLLFTAINLLVLYLLMKRFLFKPIHKILEERQAQVDQDLAQAAEAKSQAEALEKQHSESLKGIEEEKRQVLADARKQASAEYAQLIAQANERADSMIEDARHEAQNQKDEILRQAQGEISELVIAATAKVAGVGNGDDGALYDEFLKKAGEADD